MKKLLSAVFAAIAYFSFPGVVSAHCPLCVVGAGAGLTLSRWIGLDDSITGLWLAAFLGAVSLWTYFSLVRKIKRGQLLWLKPALYVLIFGSTIWTFYKFNLVVKMGTIFGIDKLTFGLIVGGIAFYIIDTINTLILKIHGKSFFPYQRIVFSLGTILALSIIDYFLISYYI